MSTLPNRWTLQELQADAATAKGIFRHERVGEPLDLYKKFFDTFAAIFRNTIGELPAIASDPVDASLVSRLVTGRNQQKAFRYLAAPPISEDDLKALAETNLAPSVLKVDVPAAQRVRDTVLALLDPHRFPWISARRAPTDEETERAIIASSALAAAREVETLRRNVSKQVQERAVKNMLASAGMIEVNARDIPILTAAPAPGDTAGRAGSPEHAPTWLPALRTGA